MKTILMIDDDRGILDYLEETLTHKGYHVFTTTSPTEALQNLDQKTIDLVITDIEMPNIRGTELLKMIQHKYPEKPVLMMTAFGSIDLAVETIKAGASDFITKPFKIETLIQSIEHVLNTSHFNKESQNTEEKKSIFISEHVSMKHIQNMIHKVAPLDTTILITGETGTGKSALARYIHACSKRNKEVFLEINCASIPNSLIDSELFGVKKGTFTGATTDTQGLFVAANQGTLFLDEIAELSLESQAKLLHVLESKTIRALGSTQTKNINTRVIAATNQPIEKKVQEGLFRPDLYYRLNLIHMHVPPLKERIEDIPALAQFFIQHYSKRYGRENITLSSDAIEACIHYTWPGNVRELSNVIERSMAIYDTHVFTAQHLNLNATVHRTHSIVTTSSLEDIEKSYVEEVMRVHGGNKSAAARALGINRRTLIRKLQASHKK